MSTIEITARSIVFWPGMIKDIKVVRSKCNDCNHNAPSQAQLPLQHSEPPLTPFEAIFQDIVLFGGSHYLVIGVRFSGWTSVFHTSCGSVSAGAHGLIQWLRNFFSILGEPHELFSDGGPEFKSYSVRSLECTPQNIFSLQPKIKWKSRGSSQK